MFLKLSKTRVALIIWFLSIVALFLSSFLKYQPISPGKLSVESFRDIVILLTTTLKPSSTQIKRNSIELRFKDYEKSIKFWCTLHFRIVILENSNSFKEAYNLKKHCPQKIEIFFVPPTEQPDIVNYGRQEASAIRHFLLQPNQAFTDGTYFIKVTGRLIIPNVVDIVQGLECKSYRSGCPSSYLNPHLHGHPHSQNPFISTTFMIFTAKTYLELLSVEKALPTALGYAIERSLADHLLTECSAGFDVYDIRKNCGVSFLECVKRDGIVGWSGLPYTDDTDCQWNRKVNQNHSIKKKSSSQVTSNTIVGDVPPVIFYNSQLLAAPSKRNNKVAILGFFEETVITAGSNKDHLTTTKGLQTFMESIIGKADVFVFARRNKSSILIQELVNHYGHRYILFHPPSHHMAPPRYTNQWTEILIGGAPKFFFLRFVVYEFAISHFINQQYTHFILIDLNDSIFQIDTNSSSYSNRSVSSNNAVGGGDEGLDKSIQTISSEKLLPAFEFSSWSSPSESSKINRMWLGGCATQLKEQQQQQQHLVRGGKYQDSKSGLFDLIEPLHKYMDTSICNGHSWDVCPSSILHHPLPLEYISCAGTIIGNRPSIQKYLTFYSDMHIQNVFCNDQGLHNLILNFGLRSQEFVSSEPHTGVILTMDSMDDSQATIATTPTITTNDTTTTANTNTATTNDSNKIKVKDSVIMNSLDQAYLIIHQYNRCASKSSVCHSISSRSKS